jgi:hypothetical protein
MSTKTWKLGEVCRGGIITVETTGKKIAVIGKEWDYSKGSRRSSDQSNAKEWCRKEVDGDSENAYRELYTFLSDLTTHYYAETIIEWIQTKVEFRKSFFW